MPSAEAILTSASRLANDWIPLAIVWHVLLAGLIAALALSRRLSIRTVALSTALPALSVSALAWFSGNAFTGTLLGVLWLMLTAIGIRLRRDPIWIGSSAFAVPGALLIAFGWVYPHFVETDSFVTYLYGAPFGLLPCPTLSAMIGITLLTDLADSRAWVASLVSAGLLYGAIGVFRLNVMLDLALLAGSLLLAVTAIVLRHSSHVDAHAM